MKSFWGILVSISLVAFLGWYIDRGNLNFERESIIPSGNSENARIFENGEQVDIEIVATRDRVITGLILFAATERYSGVWPEVTILDHGGEVRAIGEFNRTEYRHDKLAVHYYLDWLEATPKEKLILRIVARDSDFPLMAGVSYVYRGVEAGNARPGILAGFIVGFGLLLMSRLRQYKWHIAGLVFMVSALIATSGFWFSTGDWGQSDWDLYFPEHDSYLKTVVEYGQFPFWNPYTFGGVAGLGDPEFAVLSFTFFWQLLFGVITGYKLALLTSIVVSGFGMFAIAKRLKLSPEAALLASFAFSLSSTVLLKFVEGHIQHIAIAWIPWVFWSWLTAYERDDWRWRFLTGLFLALMFYQGGIYMLFYLVPGLVLMPWVAKDFLRALRVTVVAGLWSVGLSAFKLLPVLYWIREWPDDFYHVSQNTLLYWIDIFARRHLHGSSVVANQGGGWHEYGAFVGLVVIGLFVVGLARVKQSRIARVILFGFVVALLVSAGGFALEPVFDVLTFLPRSNISRMALFAVLFGVLLAGFGLDLLPKRVKPVLVALAAVEIMSFAYVMSLQAFTIPRYVEYVEPARYPIEYTADARILRINGSDEGRSYAASLAGYGTLAYRPPLAPPLGVKVGADVDYLETRGDVLAELVRWSPNEVVVRVVAHDEGAVILNANYSQGWRANAMPAKNISDRVGVNVLPGDTEIIFRYRPKGYLIGLVISLFTILFGFVLLYWHAREFRVYEANER